MSISVLSQSSNISNLNASLLQNALGSASKVKDFSKSVDTSFAKKGDPNYNEVADTDKDGQLTYDEYIKYCSEHAVSNSSSGLNDTVVEYTVDPLTQLQGLRPLSFGRIAHAYTANGMAGLHRSLVDCEV